jgi:hypothetical protein
MIALLAAPSGEGAKAGPWWFVVILLLCVASYFLYRSMSKHLRKVRDGFSTGNQKPQQDPAPAERPSLAKPTDQPRRDVDPSKPSTGVDPSKPPEA